MWILVALLFSPIMVVFDIESTFISISTQYSTSVLSIYEYFRPGQKSMCKLRGMLTFSLFLNLNLIPGT